MRRRNFLRGAGALALAVPFLPSLRHARAATAPLLGIKRAVFLTTRYGAVHYNWFPSDSSRAAQRVSPRAMETDLSAFTGDISPVFDQATWSQPATGGELRDHLLMLDGIDGVYGCGHMRHYALNGHPAGHGVLLGPLIDQLIAASPALYSGTPAYRSLHIRNGAAS